MRTETLDDMPDCPECRKLWANKKVHFALRTGELTKPETCSICNGADRRIIAHHADYTKPLDVDWLCDPCHGLVRRHPDATFDEIRLAVEHVNITLPEETKDKNKALRLLKIDEILNGS